MNVEKLRHTVEFALNFLKMSQAVHLFCKRMNVDRMYFNSLHKKGKILELMLPLGYCAIVSMVQAI